MGGEWRVSECDQLWITDNEVEVAFKFYQDSGKYFRFYLYFTATTKTFLPSILSLPNNV